MLGVRPEQIKRIRERSHLSEAAFAALLNTTVSTYRSFWKVRLHHFQLPVLGSSRFERSTSGQATSSGVVEGGCGVGLRAKNPVGLNLNIL
jgi:hypothetical protein